MRWIYNYQLFLFDFDGLLVNTEELHFKAYQNVSLRYAAPLNWDLHRYCRTAMLSATALKEALYKAYPDLQNYSWEKFYAEKREEYLRLLQAGRVTLMEGVEELLLALEKAGIKRCVVTHSPLEQIALLRQQLPILETIPHWITREHYKEPKPNPECYRHAIDRLATGDDRVIGFEDSPKGLQALLGSRAEGVLISPFFSAEEVAKMVERPFVSYSSLRECSVKRVG